MKIGLYFGSFNPVHIGHLIIASHVANSTGLDQVWFVVSPQNPLKPSSTLLNENSRLHMIQSAIEGEKKLRASNIEFKLPRPSYTVDTLAYLKEIHPLHQFSIVMGSDSYKNLSNWKNHKIILNNYQLYIYLRSEFAIPEPLPRGVTILTAPLLQISSTRIRDMIKEKKSIRFLVPDTVLEEISAGGYYR